MKKSLWILVSFSLCSSVFAQETSSLTNARPYRRGEAAGYSSRQATTLSMMGWGLGLAVGMATLCALIPNHTQTSHNH